MNLFSIMRIEIYFCSPNLKTTQMKRKISGTITARQINMTLLIMILFVGCTTTDEVVIVPRDAASVGSYPIVGTSQTKSWDSAGNIITPVLGEAFYGQDAQYVHTTPVYTKSQTPKNKRSVAYIDKNCRN